LYVIPKAEWEVAKDKVKTAQNKKDSATSSDGERKGLIVKALNLNPSITRQRLKDTLEIIAPTAYIDLKVEGDLAEAFIRYNNEKDATSAVLFFESNIIDCCGSKLSLSKLDTEEEAQYWVIIDEAKVHFISSTPFLNPI
jgi:hypothetical protein